MVASIAVLIVALCCCGRAQEPLWIDFNPDNGRSDVLSDYAFNWPVGTCSVTERTLSNTQFQLRPVGGEHAELTFGWWKAGYDSGATLCSDGVTTVAAGESIELKITGLTAGNHTLATWHNDWQSERQSDLNTEATGETKKHVRIEMQVGDTRFAQKIPITHRVTADDQAATSFFRFAVRPGDTVTVRFKPDDNDGHVVLNGLALDINDPAWEVTSAWPKDNDEHVPNDPHLKWKAPRQILSQLPSRVSYRVYFGTDKGRVKNANETQPEFAGETQQPTWPVRAADCMAEYFWRVDVHSSEGAEGSYLRGAVRRFKTRELAFPGAEGYGRFAIGGRGGRVLEVTNLNDSGPGSLRAAVEADGPRTVVFRVAGTIQLKSKLVIRNPYITIAGQTAPGDGICIRGYTFGCMGTHDVILRHLRIRIGDESGETMDGTGFASTDHAIIDHCSVSWSIDEAVSSRSAKNITLQRCIIAEALNVANHRKYQAGKGHSFAASISGDIGSFHHNLLAHCAGRNWSLAGGLDRGGHFAGRLDIRNNVVYNWQHRTNDGGAKAVNLVNNLYLPGPATKVFHLLKPDAGSLSDPQQYFVAGNRMEGTFDETGDNWRDAVICSPDYSQEVLDAIRLEQPFCEPHVETTAVDQLLENVLGDVGANHQGHDAVDQRVLSDVRSRSHMATGSRGNTPGIIDSQTDVGGWPELKSGEPPADTDHDGMPDDWEVAHGLDPHQTDTTTRLRGSNTTALEQYLAELLERTR